MFISLPYDSGKDDECENPQYGLYVYADRGEWYSTSLWLWLGKKSKVVYLPWSLDWVRTSVFLNNGQWEHETKRNSKKFWDVDKWKDKLHTETFDYTYILNSGEIQKRITTVNLTEREWRPKWFKWTKLFALIIKTIDINFNDEVGKGTGSWKGGVFGTGHSLLKGETIEQCFRRFEKEVKFNR